MYCIGFCNECEEPYINESLYICDKCYEIVICTNCSTGCLEHTNLYCNRCFGHFCDDCIYIQELLDDYVIKDIRKIIDKYLDSKGLEVY